MRSIANRNIKVNIHKFFDNKENVDFLKNELCCEVHIACNFDYMNDTDVDRTKKYIEKLFDILNIPSMTYLPGNLAFFLVLSIFPILTLIGVIASKFSINVDSFIEILNTALPNKVAEILSLYIQGKGFDSNIGVFMIIGFFLASNGTNAIIYASNELYGFPNSDAIRRRVKAILLIIIIILLFIFMLGFVAFGNHILELVLDQINDKVVVNLIRDLFGILKWPFSIFIIFFNVKLIYTITPDWKIMSKYTTKGAAFTTISWILIIKIYSYWVTHFSSYDIFYGSLSNIVILMLMTYIISYILVIGIAINVRSYEYKKEDIAASFQEVATNILIRKVNLALDKYKEKELNKIEQKHSATV